MHALSVKNRIRRWEQRERYAKKVIGKAIKDMSCKSNERILVKVRLLKHIVDM